MLDKKVCKYCGSSNLYKSKNGKRTFNFCVNHKDYHYQLIQETLKKTNLEKYGVEYSLQSKDIREKAEKTIKEKYGVDNISQSKEIKKKKKQTLLENFGSENFNNREKAKQTNLEKYGVENPQQSLKIKSKTKQTNLDRYGVEHPLQSDEIKEKIKLTNLERYGVVNVNSSEEIKEKKKQTNLERYGFENQFVGLSEQIKQTNLEKYGYTYPQQSDEIKEKIKKTNLEKYGGISPSHNELIKEKIRQTNLEKYGHTCYLKTDEYKKQSKINHRNKYWDIMVDKTSAKKIIPLFNKEYYMNNDVFKFKCERCGNIFETTETNSYHINCGCLQFKSKYEDEIKDWLESLNNNIQIIKNKRSISKTNPNMELDIYISDYNLGIDFHGLYWHSDIYKDKNYHQEKWRIFKNSDINILQIFENEWISKQDIVKSIILSKLNIYDARIYARETIIKKLDADIYRKFLEENHIQGSINSSIKLGLYYNDELISVLGVGNSRFKKNEIEIHRFCNKLNTRVVGGFSKLLSYYKNNNEFDSIISYIDLRYFDGSGYIKNGFEIESITNPNYFYFKENDYCDIFSRINFQKHKLKDKLERFDSNKTEYENMIENGFYRIFDAGNYRLIYRKIK